MARILWLHDMGDPRSRRSAIESLETMLERHAQGHDTLVLDARISPRNLRSIRWDAVVLGPTFLCNRYSSERLAAVEKRFGWIAHIPACKIALPQDDYDCSEILDEWLVRWGVDVCYSVLPGYADILYPSFSESGEVRRAFTGYLDNRWIKMSAKAPVPDRREFDVFYRASRLPANFGSLGQLKAEIADRFISTAGEFYSPAALDISCSPRDVISGDAWFERLGNSRFTLASPSGSSLLDPRGHFRDCVSRQAPDLTFDQVAQKCFPNQDNRYSFEAIAPRHIEAALWGTVQIALKGNYSNILEPNEHYIALERDFSNLPDVMALLKDDQFVSRIRQAARERVLALPELRLENFVADLLSIISLHQPPLVARGEEPSPPLKTSHRVTVNRRLTWYWRGDRARSKVIRIIDRLGLGKVARKVRQLLRGNL